tara:strand:- start:1104 stop:1967 length:864 start_codon:yes stop_codon:yes gene_type:complete
MNNYSSLSHRSQEPENGILYLVGSPIGNLSDISSRAINILKNVDLIACEDTRQTRKIMNSLEISNKLISFNQHNSSVKIPILIKFLNSGNSIALISDAGMPGICDPGEDLVKKILSIGGEAICIPGPCAALTALVSSGFPSSKFIFEGFLPKKKSDREKLLIEISQNEKTTILFEAPHRLKKLLTDLKFYCGGERIIHISRELTKRFEENINTDINNAIKLFENREAIGEFTLIIKGKYKSKDIKFDKISLKNDLHELVNAGLSLSSAAKYLAKKRNVPKNTIYKLY